MTSPLTTTSTNTCSELLRELLLEPCILFELERRKTWTTETQRCRCFLLHPFLCVSEGVCVSIFKLHGSSSSRLLTPLSVSPRDFAPAQENSRSVCPGTCSFPLLQRWKNLLECEEQSMPKRSRSWRFFVSISMDASLTKWGEDTETSVNTCINNDLNETSGRMKNQMGLLILIWSFSTQTHAAMRTNNTCNSFVFTWREHRLSLSTLLTQLLLIGWIAMNGSQFFRPVSKVWFTSGRDCPHGSCWLQ